MKWVQVVDKVDEINTLNEIRIRLSNEFEPLKETNLYNYATSLVDEKMVEVINKLKKGLEEEKTL